MKKILMIFILLLSVSSIYAVKYRSVGNNAEFSAYLFDNEYYLILSFTDGSDYHLIEKTIVKFKLKDGSVIKLGGVQGSTSEKSSSYFFGYDQASTRTEKNVYAMLKITKQQIEMLKEGVEIVMINTIPSVYMRNSWSGKDKFGPGLYVDFQSLKEEF